MSDFAKAIREQLTVLEADVAHNPDPRLVTIQHLQAALAYYENSTDQNKAGSFLGRNVPKAVAMEVAPHRQSDPLCRSDASGTSRPAKVESKINRIYEAVGSHIDKYGPTHRKDLVQMLTELGIMGGENHPLSAFATSMHTLRNNFVSDGKGVFRRADGAPNIFAPDWRKKHDQEQKEFEPPVEVQQAAQ